MVALNLYYYVYFYNGSLCVELESFCDDCISCWSLYIRFAVIFCLLGIIFCLFDSRCGFLCIFWSFCFRFVSFVLIQSLLEVIFCVYLWSFMSNCVIVCVFLCVSVCCQRVSFCSHAVSLYSLFALVHSCLLSLCVF